MVKHWFLQVAFLEKEKTMHGSSKLAKSLRQVQVINVMQSRQTHGYGDIETQTPYTHNLMYSPITDVYNIGLGVIQETSKQYVIQLNVPHAAEKFLNLNRLESVLYNNPDLASLPRTSTVDIMQTLFICTGYDYVS